MDYQIISWISFAVNTLYTHRNRILKFLLKYKAGKIFLGIVFAPFFLCVMFILIDLYKKNPDLLKKYNTQKKITDFT